MGPKGTDKCEGKVVATCSSCRQEGRQGDAVFTFHADWKGDQGELLMRTWNCDRGHTLAEQTIAQATAQDYAGVPAPSGYNGECD